MAKSVLLVDDDPDLICLLTYLFNDAGISVVAAKSLAELKRKPTEAVLCDRALLDINLGAFEPSGIDVYNWLKSISFPGKIIFFTGHGRWHPEVVRALALPGVEVLEKPSGHSELLKLVA